MSAASTPRGYGIAVFDQVDLGPEIWSYLELIEQTFAPYGGAWVVHGSPPEPVEGSWPGDIVIIAFPTLAQARAWYVSPAYQEILPLRTGHSRAAVALVEGVPEGYRAEQTVAKLKAAVAGEVRDAESAPT